MFKSIQWKVLAMFILLILSVMIFVGAFSIRGISEYYHTDFRLQMSAKVFTADVIRQLEEEVKGNDDAKRLGDLLSLYSVRMGIDSYRNFYVLDGKTAKCLYGGSNELLPQNYEITDNIISALDGKVGDEVNERSDVMDYAQPIMKNSEVKYIIYVADTKIEMREEMKNIFSNILVALAFGILISVILGFFLSKTIIAPLATLQSKAERIAAGNFGQKIPVNSNDEIGKLTTAFNEMASELKETLEQIAGEKNKIETIFLYMTDGVMAFDIDGEIIHINPAAKKMLGVNGAVKFEEFFNSLGLDISMAYLLYMDQNVNLEKEITVEDRHIKAYFAPFKIQDERASGVVVVFQDITRQQKLETSRREFVANVSHELRTPLTTIKSYAETLIDSLDKDKDEFSVNFLKVIETEADRMTRIVKDLLTLSRLDNSMEINKRGYDLGEMVSNVVGRMGIDAKNHEHKLTATIKENLPPMYGDPDRIEQVIINIISNAIKYTPNGGEIKVSCTSDKNNSYIIVADNGIGIPKEDQTRIFERFYRVDKARSREYGGTGLGLAIAKELVEAHGGSISIKSVEGKGTEVDITLPIS